ncbi:calcium-binding protein [Nocardioides marmoribigeumensis]|uniref:Ca2+-binding RTX toxin-like protein n=1 Tax=Nocardioides marmoribigeumensis TaxID=433649 RepID=A0ABU2BYA2_9ACTN|nr:calcium-binding protein [Nocardioides marmoribigeumensis]MDR7363391.1 Ca2+-binding RTX toxin-like protein [Nocardioides marmoribigeumensis]
MRPRLALVPPVLLLAAWGPGLAQPAGAALECFGRSPTHVMGTAEGTYTGTNGPDVIIGSSANDVIYALDGDDLICGRGGNDDLWGAGGYNRFLPGDGDDRVFGNSSLRQDSVWYTGAPGPVTASLATATVTGEGTDDLSYVRILHGSPYADDLTGYDGLGTVYGGPGDDTLRLGNASGAAAEGEEGDDTLLGGPADDSLNGGPGNDVLEGGSGNDDLVGDHTATSSDDDGGPNGDDVLRGGEGDDHLWGMGGADQLTGGPGDDWLNGAGEIYCVKMQGCESYDSSGADRVVYSSAPGPAEVDLGAGSAEGDGADQVTDVEQVVGSRFADVLTGSAGADRLSGVGGSDTLAGLGGADVLLGGAGDDAIGGGADVDTVSYTSSSTAVVVDLTAGTAAGEGRDTLTDVENATGSAYGDRLRGTPTVNVLVGSTGTDTLLGRGGADTLTGGEGSDSLTPGTGADTVSGGSGTDLLRYAEATAGVVVDLAAGTATGEGPDAFTGIENVLGSSHADTLRGNDLANRLSGGAGPDRLVGRGGTDTCLGGSGTDTAGTCEVLSSVP